MIFFNFVTNRSLWQVLRDGQLQGGRDRRLEAEGGDAVRRGRHLAVQEGQPDHVRVGDPGQAALRGGLLSGQRPQRQLHQQASLRYSSKVCFPSFFGVSNII